LPATISQRTAGGEQVAAAVERLPARLLGAHVGRCSEEAAGHRQVLSRVARLRDPEVGDLYAVAGLDHDVGGLDVAVDDAVLVGVVESLGNLRAECRRLPTCARFPRSRHDADPSMNSIAM
jgi:hypothetical protein